MEKVGKVGGSWGNGNQGTTLQTEEFAQDEPAPLEVLRFYDHTDLNTTLGFSSDKIYGQNTTLVFFAVRAGGPACVRHTQASPI